MNESAEMLRTTFWLALAALLLIGQAASALEQDRIAILDLANHAQLASQETVYITDIVRAAAMQALVGGQFIIMTRDNVLELLPANSTLADCLGDCAVQTGRRLGARFVVAGEVLLFSGEYRVSLQMYSTVDGNLIATERVGASELLGLEGPLANTARRLFRSIGGSQGVARFEDTQIGSGQAPWSPNAVAEVVVSFASEPEGATVEIGQIPECITPCARPLVPGEYLISMKYPRYLPESRMISVQEGIPPITMKLEPNFGWLTVSSSPSGLPATIDGDEVGRTPVREYEVSPGSHEVLIADGRYQETGLLMHIDRGEKKHIELSPVPRLGAIKLRVVDRAGNAVDATVNVNGHRSGRSWAPISLLIGAYDVEIESQFGEWRDSLEVTEGELLDLSVRLSGALTGIDDMLAASTKSTAPSRTQRGFERLLLVGALGAGGAALYSDMELRKSWKAYEREIGTSYAHDSYLEYDKWFERRKYTLTTSIVCAALWVVSKAFHSELILGGRFSPEFELAVGPVSPSLPYGSWGASIGWDF